MTNETRTRDAERPTLDERDVRLIARMREEWAPEPLTAAGRTAFDARLQERIEAARRRRWWPALGASLATASLAALLVLRAQPPAPSPAELAERGATAERLAATDEPAWIDELLYATVDDDDAQELDDAGLPDEYVAIAAVLLDL
jgi:hypothetical protein